GVPVPSGVQEPAHCAASAVLVVHRGGDRSRTNAFVSRALVAILAACVVLFPLLPRSGVIGCAAALVALCVAAWARREPALLQAAVFFATTLVLVVLDVGVS